MSESRLGRLTGVHAFAHARTLPHSRIGGRLRDTLSTLGEGPVGARLRRLVVGLRTAVVLTRLVGYRIYGFAYWAIAGFNQPRLVPARIRARTRQVLAALSAGTEASSGASDHARARLGPLSVVPAVVQALVTASRKRFRSVKLAADLERARLPLHTNASGDFTLMARDDWFSTHGYAELQMYSMHIDGLHLYVSHYLRIRERVVPYPVFHIEHGGGFRPEAKGDQSLGTSLAQRAIPQITNDQLMDYIRQMYFSRHPVPFNGPEWGLAGADLRETDPVAGRQRVEAELRA